MIAGVGTSQYMINPAIVARKKWAEVKDMKERFDSMFKNVIDNDGVITKEKK